MMYNYVNYTNLYKQPQNNESKMLSVQLNNLEVCNIVLGR